ncbi:uncharacterized protein LOC103514129 [Diaphorina citri]|uniref:Uncharacterized protein LOC103514129 n=1 Tax=Diaphorina citri TaxID=121845 RepID=A0A1S3D9P9_DIACI|nr:uncharacterized protein LOC103514129 [Diaphorina citri]
MLSFATLALCLNFAYGIGKEETEQLHQRAEQPVQNTLASIMPDLIRTEIMRTFPGVSNETLLIDFLNNGTYLATLIEIQLQMCYIDAVSSHGRVKRDLFPKDFWVKDVHKGYYHYLKHLDPFRWFDEAYGWVDQKSSLPPLYYVAKYCPEEMRFLKDMDYHEDYYKNLTWPQGLDPFWTGNPNMTTNLFTEVTESSSSESLSWEPYTGESTTTDAPENYFWKF